MPIVSTKEILDRAFADRYGVAAFNILDDLTIDAVLAAAEEERAPVILQTSVKTVRAYGRDRLIGVFRAMARDTTVPVAVHLDHCPYRDVITECLDAGWNSVLFDAHELDVADNLAQTIEVVAEAHGHGAAVEGEIEGIEGKEDDIGSDEASELQSLETAVDFIRKTGVDVFAPAIGNAHGQYKSAPKLDHQRVTDLVEATNIPMALHGGTGLSARPVPRPHRPRLRQGQHLHGDQGVVHEVGPRAPQGGRGEEQVGSAHALRPPARRRRLDRPRAHRAVRRLGQGLVTVPPRRGVPA